MPRSALSQLARRTGPPPIAWLMKMGLDRPNLISLAAGFIDHESLPVAETKMILSRLFRKGSRARAALQYGSTAGLLSLRSLTAARIQALDDAGRMQDPGRVVISHGSQQLLYILTECLCDPGDIVLVEDPTYFVYLSIAQSHGVRCVGVPMRAEGLDVARLQSRLEALKKTGALTRVKMVVLISYFQNPTGRSASLENKAAILEVLRAFERSAGHPIYLLEDAAYRELRFAGAEIPSALALDGADQRLLYLGTYSKPFATGIRAGFGIFPEPVLTAVLRLKANHDFGTSNLLQHLLTEAIESGIYDRHLRTLQKRYAAKERSLDAALRLSFGALARWERPRGGLCFWVSLPKTVATGFQSDFFKKALAQNVLYLPGGLCYTRDDGKRPPQNELRISFGAATLPQLREGVRRLGSIAKKLAG